ncbi:MAG: dihydrofolate reductase [Celeribacter marinus]
MISLIVARDRNGAIGKGNDIPWHAPEDLKFFMRETMGGAVIMGRNTWDSLPAAVRPLKNRLNIVVSSKGVDHEYVFATLDAAIAFAKSQGRARIYGMGGAGIYAAMMPMADRLLITEVDLEVEDADTWFAQIDEAEWREVARITLGGAGPRCEVVERLRIS